MGFLLLERLAERYDLRWTKPQATFFRAETHIRRVPTIVLKPNTFVNLSGKALCDFKRDEAFSAEELLVLCDDFALDLGLLRLRCHGRDGGHNGLKSIIDEMGTREFPRLRMGVGPVPSGVLPADFVLESFPEDDRDVVDGLLERAVSCVESVACDGFETAMSRFNTRQSRAESD
jgi:PTH1 family peptidyl-tRNA hydrolase